MRLVLADLAFRALAVVAGAGDLGRVRVTSKRVRHPATHAERILRAHLAGSARSVAGALRRSTALRHMVGEPDRPRRAARRRRRDGVGPGRGSREQCGDQRCAHHSCSRLPAHRLSSSSLMQRDWYEVASAGTPPKPAGCSRSHRWMISTRRSSGPPRPPPQRESRPVAPPRRAGEPRARGPEPLRRAPPPPSGCNRCSVARPVASPRAGDAGGARRAPRPPARAARHRAAGRRRRSRSARRRRRSTA